MIDRWNKVAASSIHTNKTATNSREHWHSMATSVVENVKAQRDIYSWDGKYLGTIIPLSE